MGNRIWNVIEELKPVVVMVIVQIAFAGINVFYKLAANDGMDLRVLVAFRFLFAAAFISPIAFFLERSFYFPSFIFLFLLLDHDLVNGSF